VKDGGSCVEDSRLWAAGCRAVEGGGSCGLWRNGLRRRMKDGELWIAGCRTVDLEPPVVGLGWVRKISTMKSNVGG
jgi:hypothetical protein